MVLPPIGNRNAEDLPKRQDRILAKGTDVSGGSMQRGAYIQARNL